MTIVDNNILSALAKVERLDLLPAVFDSIGTPPSVVDELDRAKAAGYDFVDRIDVVTTHNGGWLTVVSPAGKELELAEDIRDHALSITDARCLAVAATRDRRLVTDDAHVGTVARQHDTELWDLVLLLQAAIRNEVITSRTELSTLIDDPQARDNYRFSMALRASSVPSSERNPFSIGAFRSTVCSRNSSHVSSSRLYWSSRSLVDSSTGIDVREYKFVLNSR